MPDERELLRPPSPLERWSDRLFRGTTVITALFVIVVVVVVVGQVGRTAAPAISEYGASLITSTSYDQTREEFGLLPSIWGTLYTSALALILATFFGVTTAIVLTEDFLPSRLRGLIREAVQLLAAIPSVIYGLWGMAVVIPHLREPAGWLHRNLGWMPLFETEFAGYSVLTSVVVLAIMVLPTITALSVEAIATVPPSLRAGAYALGATRWEAIRKVILPTALTGISGAVVLGFGRALGETMALAMLVGNSTSDTISFSVLAPGNTLAALIANKFPEAGAGSPERGALMYAAVVLLLITLVVNVLGELIIWRSSRRLRGLRR